MIRTQIQLPDPLYVRFSASPRRKIGVWPRSSGEGLKLWFVPTQQLKANLTDRGSFLPRSPLSC